MGSEYALEFRFTRLREKWSFASTPIIFGDAQRNRSQARGSAGQSACSSHAFRASSMSNNLRIFISYSHDAPEHEQRVLALSERLRKDGIDAQMDQYVQGTPP